MSNAEPGLPQVLYLPTLEVTTADDGLTQLVAYSSLDLLQEGHGDVSWRVVSTRLLPALHAETPWDRLVVDGRPVQEVGAQA